MKASLDSHHFYPKITECPASKEVEATVRHSSLNDPYTPQYYYQGPSNSSHRHFPARYPDSLRLQRNREDQRPTGREEQRVDELYSCVAELKRFPESLLNDRGSNYIALDYNGKRYRSLSRIIALPSGRKIYVADINGKMMISEGERHHLEYDIFTQNRAKSSLMLLWAQWRLGYAYSSAFNRTTLFKPGATGTANVAYPSGMRSLTAALANNLNMFSGWRDVILWPIHPLFSAFKLPCAAAQEALDEVNNHKKQIEEQWPSNINDLFFDEDIPAVILQGCHTVVPETDDEHSFTIKNPLLFLIDGQETTLFIPDYHAQIEFERLTSIF